MFNTCKFELNRKKAIKFLDNSPFHKFICQDMIDRLAFLDRRFGKILIINPILENFFIEELAIKYPDHQLTIAKSIKEIDFLENKFDLIIFPFGMHWIFDLQKFLKQIYEILGEAGIFICNFAGGDTLSKLRRKLISLEHEFTGKHVPHISPFIQFEHMNPLLMQAGFVENVIDIEEIELEYETPLSLMKALKAAGEANTIEGGIFYSITKTMYRQLDNSGDKPFIDQVNLISFISSRTKRNIKLLKEHFQN